MVYVSSFLLWVQSWPVFLLCVIIFISRRLIGSHLTKNNFISEQENTDDLLVLILANSNIYTCPGSMLINCFSSTLWPFLLLCTTSYFFSRYQPLWILNYRVLDISVFLKIFFRALSPGCNDLSIWSSQECFSDCQAGPAYKCLWGSMVSAEGSLWWTPSSILTVTMVGEKGSVPGLECIPLTPLGAHVRRGMRIPYTLCGFLTHEL